MSQQRSSTPLSSWLAPLIPGSWIQGKALHLKKADAVSLVGYGTVMSMFCNTAGEASTLKQLLLFWGCTEAAFYVYQKWRYVHRHSDEMQLMPPFNSMHTFTYYLAYKLHRPSFLYTCQTFCSNQAIHIQLHTGRVSSASLLVAGFPFTRLHTLPQVHHREQGMGRRSGC